MNQSKASARYYMFEEMLEETPGFAHMKKRAPMANLQMLAAVVWANEGGRGKCPAIKTRRQNDYSHYEYVPGSGKTGTVFLTRKHQNLCGLLHELAHALGHRDKLTHGPKFRARCMHLYKLYGGWTGEIDWPTPQRKARR